MSKIQQWKQLCEAFGFQSNLGPSSNEKETNHDVNVSNNNFTMEQAKQRLIESRGK